MHTDNLGGLSREVWRTFFETRALGLVVLAVAVLTPFVPVDPRVAIFSVALGVPISLGLRAALDVVVRHSWVVVAVDTVLICVAISIDPVIAPAGGVLLLASSSLTAASAGCGAAPHGHAGSQAPQKMHASGSMKSWSGRELRCGSSSSAAGA